MSARRIIPFCCSILTTSFINKFTKRLIDRSIQISMDGRGRALDNVFVERLWRSVKYEEIFLNDYPDVETAVRLPVLVENVPPLGTVRLGDFAGIASQQVNPLARLAKQLQVLELDRCPNRTGVDGRYSDNWSRIV